MAKEEREFFDVDEIGWGPVQSGSGASGAGLFEKILSRDPETGDYTRMLRFDPGTETAEVLEHDFWEEVIILEGRLVDKRLNREFTKGMYACRPPGMKHGPYKAPEGCMTFEVRYHKGK